MSKPRKASEDLRRRIYDTAAEMLETHDRLPLKDIADRVVETITGGVQVSHGFDPLDIIGTTFRTSVRAQCNIELKDAAVGPDGSVYKIGDELREFYAIPRSRRDDANDDAWMLVRRKRMTRNEYNYVIETMDKREKSYKWHKRALEAERDSLI